MPAELLNLKEQLQNLQVVYQAAVAHNKPIEELEKLRLLMLDIQERIIQRQKILNETENSN